MIIHFALKTTNSNIELLFIIFTPQRTSLFMFDQNRQNWPITFFLAISPVIEYKNTIVLIVQSVAIRGCQSGMGRINRIGSDRIGRPESLPDVFGQFPRIFETKVGINRGKILISPYF